MHSGPRIRALILLGLAAALTVACATLPEVHPWYAGGAKSKPTLVGANGPLPEKQAQAVLARLEAKGANKDLLARHLALEEEVAGQPLTIGNAATLLVDGPAAYKAMFDAIDRARDHINCEFYIIDYDASGKAFADALIRKAKAGVAVQLIFDSAGSLETPREYFERLRAAGVKLVEYNPVNPLQAKRGWRVNNRDHRKLLIVDGRVAFLGGINISDVYSKSSSGRGSAGSRGSGGRASGGGSGPRIGAAPEGDVRKAGWRDTQVKLEGPVVEQLQRLFLDSWQKSGGEALPKRAWFPGAKAQGEHPVRVIASGPDNPVPAIYVALISAINAAEKSVHLTAAYFVPDRQTLDALKAAAARGVDVTLVLPSVTDFWLVFHAGRSHYADLLEAGVKIYERQEAVLHSKTVVIDGVWSTIGSSNMDWRSFLHNEELNAVILGWDFARQLEALFQRDIAASVRIDLETWSRRPPDVRMKEVLGRMWEYWL